MPATADELSAVRADCGLLTDASPLVGIEALAPVLWRRARIQTAEEEKPTELAIYASVPFRPSSGASRECSSAPESSQSRLSPPFAIDALCWRATGIARYAVRSSLRAAMV